MSLLRAAQARGRERRGADPHADWGDSTPPTNWSLGGQAAGMQVNESTALQIAAVYGSVNVIADSLASLPIDLMSSPHRRNGRTLNPGPLLTEPYAEISLIDWWVQFTISLALRGNFFGHIISRDKDLYPTQIKPIHPDHVRVQRLPGGSIEYRFHGQVVPTADVFHVKFMSVPESLVGLNPVEYLRNILGLARAADLYGASTFANSAVPNGIITVEEELDTEEAKAMKDEWLSMLQGVNRAGLPAVLSGGAKFEPIAIKPEDMQFLQSRQYDASVICGQIFRVPPHMIGIVDRTTSWGVGIEQQELGFVRNTLVGYLSRGERAMTAVHPPGQYVKFDLSERLRGDRLQRFQAYSLAIAGGWMVPDEARAGEDMSPLPGGIGKTAMAPINAQSLQQMAEESIASSASSQQSSSGSSDPSGLGSAARSVPLPQGKSLRAATSELSERVGKLEQERQSSQPQPINVNIENRSDPTPLQITNDVQPTPVNVQSPAVSVENRVETPSVSVDVAAPEVRNEIHVPEQPAPSVTVNAPEVRNEIRVPKQAPPEVRNEIVVERPRSSGRKRLIRDASGVVTGIEED